MSPVCEAIEAPYKLEPGPVLDQPIIAYRTWMITRDSKSIRSLMDTSDYPWPHMKRYEAQCSELLSIRTQHSYKLTPFENCSCGIYAFNSIESLINQRRQTGGIHVIFGKVSLWGKVIPHKFGYRAEFAYPYCFYRFWPFDYSKPKFDLLAASYGVDLEEPPDEIVKYTEGQINTLKKKISKTGGIWQTSKT